MATTTVSDLINSALRLIGQLAEGEVPSAATAQDALTTFNQMVDSWSTERLSVYGTFDQVKNWPPGERKQTLGPTGTLVGERPILVDDSTFFIDVGTGLSFPVSLINEDQYNAISTKETTSSYSKWLWVNMTYPDIELSLYPVPTNLLEFHFISVIPLPEAQNLTTVIALPPGYRRALRFNLAMELANEFGVEPSEQTKRVAMSAKRNLKRINNPDDLMSVPLAMMKWYGKYNIYTGPY